MSLEKQGRYAPLYSSPCRGLVVGLSAHVLGPAAQVFGPAIFFSDFFPDFFFFFMFFFFLLKNGGGAF